MTRFLLLSLCVALGLCSAEAAPPGAVDPTTGALVRFGQADGRPVATRFRNVYHLLSRKGDVTADEDADRVVRMSREGPTNVYRCVNGALPGLSIEKRYVRTGTGFRRTLVLASERSDGVFVRLETEGHFDAAFMEKVWYLGAGYIGPHKPYPHKPAPQEMNWYVQSTKGLVFTNPETGRGAFAHWRVAIDGTPVLPWWHSTINSYREKADRLWLLPDGYKMCLGTFQIRPDAPVTVGDRFDGFDGNAYRFFTEIFARDPAVRDELAAIASDREGLAPSRPQAWLDDLLAVVQTGECDYYRYLAEMEPDLPFLVIQTPFGNWADYRPADGCWTGNYGGTITTNEVFDYIRRMKAVAPNLKHVFYQLVISAGERTRLAAEHPDWFRRHDRAGRDDSLFPGDRNNWQTMFSVPAARDFLVSSSFDFARLCEADAIYNDEAQMTNSIDWDRDRVTRDDDVVRYWRALRRRATREGLLLFFNGSGNPYADLNCMESPHELAPHRWRDWVGVAWGIGMMNRLNPGNRTVLLYWRDGLDYVNRVLALGWLPFPAQSVRAYPLDVMRAAHQSGNLWPADIDYAPDWKRDSRTEIESHAVVRPDGPDTLLSFINRSPSVTNIPVRVSLASLGWATNEVVSVWELTPRPKPAKGIRHILSDAEIRANWARGVNAGGTFLDKRLVWSGPCAGDFRTELAAVGTNEMRQLLFVPGRLAFYATDGRPRDYPYVTDRIGRIRGSTVELTKPADLVLAAVGASFDDIRVNGQPAVTRKIAIAGRNVQLVSVTAGRSEVTWRERPAEAHSVLASDPLSWTGMPSRVRWNSGRNLPAQRELTGAHVVRANFKISARGTYKSAWRDNLSLQTGMEPMVAIADATNRTLTVGTTRREGGYDYPAVQSWAGFEICWARQLTLDYTHTFGDVNAVSSGYTNGRWPRQEENFVGFCVDYRVKGSYVRRVAFRMDGRTGALVLTQPDWGKKNAPADQVVDLGNRLEGAASGAIELNLADYAPPDWDGTVFLSAGATRLWPNRRLTLRVSPADAADCAANRDPKPRTCRPAPKLELDFWKKRHEATLAKIRSGGGHYDFVLVGDSITHNWEAIGGKSFFGGRRPLGKAVADEAFAAYRWLNLGIGGDGTSHVLWRCLNGELDGYETPLVGLMIGTNNRHDPAEDVAEGIRAILRVIREKQPQARILLSPILPRFPREDDPGDMNAKNEKTNEIIRRFCDGKTVVWFDWRAGLYANGELDKSLWFDREHPAAGGYRLWAKALHGIGIRSEE